MAYMTTRAVRPSRKVAALSHNSCRGTSPRSEPLVGRCKLKVLLALGFRIPGRGINVLFLQVQVWGLWKENIHFLVCTGLVTVQA